MKCNFCLSEINRHGNGKYCPEKNGIKDYCYKEEKKIRQKALLEHKAKIAKIENLLMGTLEGILQGNQSAQLTNINFLEKYFNDGYFQEYKVNNYLIFKFKNFQLSKIQSECNHSIFELKIINNQHEFKI
jgi:hypothetical protein